LSSAESNPEIADIGAGWTSTEQRSNLSEEGMGIAAVEKCEGVESQLLRRRPSRLIDPSACCIGWAIFPIGSCAEKRAPSQQIGAAKFQQPTEHTQRQLLVAAPLTEAVLGDRHSRFPAGENATGSPSFFVVVELDPAID
jgi:hypothetical protein